MNLLLNNEIIFASNDQTHASAIQRALKKKQIRKLAPKIYSANLHDPAEAIIKRQLFQILAFLFEGAVISHRSALEGGSSKEGVIVLTYRYTRNKQLPGIKIKLIEGPGALPSDTPILGSLFISSRARAILENLQPSRSRVLDKKTLTINEIEAWLDKLARVYGEEELNRLRDDAKSISATLDLQNEFAKLEKLISSLLGTHNPSYLTNQAAQARAIGQAYDPNRLELFRILMITLKTQLFEKKQNRVLSNSANKNFSFFDAYFSNFIEGTEFEIEEAEKIIFESRIMPSRPKDSHDILGTFQILSDQREMNKTPQSSEELLFLLKHRHLILMSARSEKNPGQFKDKDNRAGNSVFVKHEEVVGTLHKGFQLHQELPPGIARAIFMMFLISEVHPFLDGNGRLARIMMNAELVSANESRIIIPTVYREDYLLALRRLTREYDQQPYIKMLLRAQDWTDRINFENYETALIQLKLCNAFLLSNEGQLKMP